MSDIDFKMIERIEITTYQDKAEEIEKILHEFQVPYTRTSCQSYNVQCLFYIVTLPGMISSSLIEELANKIDASQKINLITHYKTESTISDYLTRFESLLQDNKNATTWKDVYDNEKDKKNHDNTDISLTLQQIKNKIKVKKTAKRPVEDLISKSDSFLSNKWELYVMTLIATVVALVGLITNSVALIIGAMLLSPLLAPISSIALNSTIGRLKELNQSVTFSAKMILSSIALATAITLGLSMIMHIQVTPEIQSRMDDRPTSIIVAVMLGIAGGVAMFTTIPEIIIGVAIAVALIPPVAVIGIGIGLGSIDIASKASLVLASNIIGLVMGFLIIFLFKGVSSRKYYEQQKAKKVIKANILILSCLAGALIFIEKFLY
ncbi:MAG: TIGR00341 family protein [Thermoproteota archaeon]|nr:TIGR00341 family protein [Thermoproteota archaeon]